jgi:hypothetical protein
MEVSKRDYFAAQALLGILSRSGQSQEPGVYEKAAQEAFLYADAMMKLSKTLLDPVEFDPDKLAKRILPGEEEETNNAH